MVHPFYMTGFTKRYNPRQPRDNSGRWAGGAGGGLSAQPAPADKPASATWRSSARSSAARVRGAAEKAEPKITADMKALVAEHGGELYGLDFRLKTSDSLARKIQADANAIGVSDKVAGDLVSDAIRYTVMEDSVGYTKAADSALSSLADSGYSLRQKNFWAPNDPYQGINVAVTSPDGVKFELQFHTPESMAVKDQIHPMYEEFRVSTDNTHRADLWMKMSTLAATIPVPPGVEAIPELKTQQLTPVVN